LAEQRVIIIAGPNGAGKTTFAREFLPLEVGITTFINADSSLQDYRHSHRSWQLGERHD